MGKANDRNPPSLSGMTPLHEAARMGHLDVVRLFLEIVEDKGPTNREGQTPLDCAKIEKHLEVAKLLEEN